MAMLPSFVVGVLVGIWLTNLHIMYKKETPSDIKIKTLEHYIESLKEDISLLESENNTLREELKLKK